MILDKREVYPLLGLKEPEAFQRDLKFRKAKLILADFKQKMTVPFKDTYYNRYDFIWNRQTGKTTDKIIEALIAEYAGETVVLMTNTNVSMARTRHIWLKYRSTLVSIYGDPYYYGGDGKVMTKERAKLYRGRTGKLPIIIDDCDF